MRTLFSSGRLMSSTISMVVLLACALSAKAAAYTVGSMDITRHARIADLYSVKAKQRTRRKKRRRSRRRTRRYRDQSRRERRRRRPPRRRDTGAPRVDPFGNEGGGGGGY